MDGLRAFIFVYPGMTGRFQAAGFDYQHMDCGIIPYVAVEDYSIVPILNITKDKGFDFYGQLEIDLMCTPKNDSTKTTFKRVFTLITNRFHTAAIFDISEGLVIRIKNL